MIYMMYMICIINNDIFLQKIAEMGHRNTHILIDINGYNNYTTVSETEFTTVAHLKIFI